VAPDNTPSHDGAWAPLWDGVCCAYTDGVQRTHFYINQDVARRQWQAGYIKPLEAFPRLYEQKAPAKTPNGRCKYCGAALIWVRSVASSCPLEAASLRVYEGQTWALPHLGRCPSAPPPPPPAPKAPRSRRTEPQG